MIAKNIKMLSGAKYTGLYDNFKQRTSNFSPLAPLALADLAIVLQLVTHVNTTFVLCSCVGGVELRALQKLSWGSRCEPNIFEGFSGR